jgi:hypothetical protein
VTALVHRPLLPSEALATPPRRTSNASAIVGLCFGAISLVPFFGIPFSLVGAIASAIGIRKGKHGVYRRTAVVGLTVSAASLVAQFFFFGLIVMFCRNFPID